MPNFVQTPPNPRALLPMLAKGAARRPFTPRQVVPFCENLVAVLNKMLPATFTLVKEGDRALSIRVEIHNLALGTGTTQTGTSDTHTATTDGPTPA